MRVGTLFGLLFVVGFAIPAHAGDCPGHPDAIGTSRALVVDPTEHVRLGTMQYRETLPLEDHEVVLTFDDGPLPPYTKRILEVLAAQCVKANYFLIGRMAQAYPEVVREIHAAGHTIGTHSQTHPYTFPRMTLAKAQQEVDQGIASVAAALGDPAEIAPFFRIPGLSRSEVIESYLASRSIMTWSADFPADDWRHISASEVIHRAITRLEAKGKGILLLHDIQPATVVALPGLLRELKRRGFRIVQVVPASATAPKTPTTPEQWVMNGARDAKGDTTSDTKSTAPPVDITTVDSVPPVLPPPRPKEIGVAEPLGPQFILTPPATRAPARPKRGQIALPPIAPSPHDLGPPTAVIDGGLPAPGASKIGHQLDIAPALAPAMPAGAASNASRGDVTGSTKPKTRRVTTANMPKSKIR